MQAFPAILNIEYFSKKQQCDQAVKLDATRLQYVRHRKSFLAETRLAVIHDWIFLVTVETVWFSIQANRDMTFIQLAQFFLKDNRQLKLTVLWQTFICNLIVFAAELSVWQPQLEQFLQNCQSGSQSWNNFWQESNIQIMGTGFFLFSCQLTQFFFDCNRVFLQLVQFWRQSNCQQGQ